MTPSLHTMLTLMQEAEDREDWENAEAVADGIRVFVGLEPFHWKTIHQGLRLMAISDVSDEGGGVRRFTINSVGRLLLKHPDQEQEVIKASLAGGAWTVKDDKFILLEEPQKRS